MHVRRCVPRRSAYQASCLLIGLDFRVSFLVIQLVLTWPVRTTMVDFAEPADCHFNHLTGRALGLHCEPEQKSTPNYRSLICVVVLASPSKGCAAQTGAPELYQTPLAF